MKTSPLLLESLEYVTLEVRALPHLDEATLARPLPISLSSHAIFSDSGNHFAMLRIWQEDKDFAYTYDIQVFCGFKLEKNACRAQYKDSFNPAVVATNICRILYSGAREMLAVLSSRAPHGSAILKSIVIEPVDVDIEFDGDRRDVLAEQFDFTSDQIDYVEEAIAAKEDQRGGINKDPKRSSKKTSERKLKK